MDHIENYVKSEQSGKTGQAIDTFLEILPPNRNQNRANCRGQSRQNGQGRGKGRGAGKGSGNGRGSGNDGNVEL